MGYAMGMGLENISVDMNVLKKLCKINEYKGEAIIYKKQPKNVVTAMIDSAITKFVFDTFSDDFKNKEEELLKLINNEISPNSKEEISILEFRDVVKTVNSAYEDIAISSQTILELHGYLHKYSTISGGKYRNESLVVSNLECKEFEELNNKLNNIEKGIQAKIENTCNKYYECISQDKVQDLIVIASFILDFIIISPFKESNLTMAKILTLLLLNKSGYEVGRFTSIGRLYIQQDSIYFNDLLLNRDDLDVDNDNLNQWLDFFLTSIIQAYEELDEETQLTCDKRETKTKRIEKIINSTLGYFTKDDIRNQCLDIPEPTINRVFNNLRKNGKIEVIAKGRSAKWKKK